MYTFWLGKVNIGIFCLSTSSQTACSEEVNCMPWLLKLFIFGEKKNHDSLNYKEGVKHFSLLLTH